MMKSLHMLTFVFMICLLVSANIVQAATITVSGGGTNVLQAAITSATHGDTIEITDSLVYTEDYQYWHIGKWDIKVMATLSQNPEINFTNGATGVSWNPNVGGFQVGDNAGGQITIRQKRTTPGSSYSAAFGTMWMPGNQTLRIENVKFTGQGADGPWGGGALWFSVDSVRAVTAELVNCEFIDFEDQHYDTQPVIWYNPWNDNSLTLNLTDCYFYQSTPATLLYAVKQYWNAHTAELNVTRCWFENYAVAINTALGTANITDTVIVNPSQFGIQVYPHNATYNISNSVFYEHETGDIFVWVCSDGVLRDNPNVTIDHCDFVSSGTDAVAVQFGNSTQATVVVKNSNVTTAPCLWASDPLPGSYSATYHHCNVTGGTEARWTDGGNNVNVVPTYNSLPCDWGYSDPSLLTADEFGGPIGSQLTPNLGPCTSGVKDWIQY